MPRQAYEPKPHATRAVLGHCRLETDISGCSSTLAMSPGTAWPAFQTKRSCRPDRSATARSQTGSGRDFTFLADCFRDTNVRPSAEPSGSDHTRPIAFRSTSAGRIARCRRSFDPIDHRRVAKNLAGGDLGAGSPQLPVCPPVAGPGADSRMSRKPQDEGHRTDRASHDALPKIDWQVAR